MRRNLWAFCSGWLLIGFALTTTAPRLCAQEDREVIQLFESMLDELSPSVRLKFEAAIAAGSSSIEFTPEEFRRFRSNPVNPFDGMADIDPDRLEGNIVLKFELPSLRTRPIRRFERQHATQLAQLQSVAVPVADSVVRIEAGGRQVGLGTVVEAGILSKASELQDRDDLVAVFRNGARVEIKLTQVDQRYDLALLQASGSRGTSLGNSRPIKFVETPPSPGAFLIAPNEQGQVFAFGTYSAQARSTAQGQRAFLGVQPIAVDSGILVEGIRPDTAAFAAGLRDGDVITRFDGEAVDQVGDLVNRIRLHQPGDSIPIDYRRGDVAFSTTAILSGQNVSGEQAAQFKMMSRLGAIPSRRGDNFPFVFQHDLPLFPEQCGGPVLDLDGRVVGLNIARNGRAASYAIPGAQVNELLAAWAEAGR